MSCKDVTLTIASLTSSLIKGSWCFLE